MADQITSVIENDDGSWSFGFLFDNGSGILGSTVVSLPAPQPTVDQNNNPVAAIPYTANTAKAAIIPIAAAQKAAWIASLQSQQIAGPVTL